MPNYCARSGLSNVIRSSCWLLSRPPDAESRTKEKYLMYPNVFSSVASLWSLSLVLRRTPHKVRYLDVSQGIHLLRCRQKCRLVGYGYSRPSSSSLDLVNNARPGRSFSHVPLRSTAENDREEIPILQQNKYHHCCSISHLSGSRASRLLPSTVISDDFVFPIPVVGPGMIFLRML